MVQITTAQAVDKFGVSRRTILRLIADDVLPVADKFPVTNGGYLFEEEAVAKAVATLPRKGKQLPTDGDAA